MEQSEKWKQTFIATQIPPHLVESEMVIKLSETLPIVDVIQNAPDKLTTIITCPICLKMLRIGNKVRNTNNGLTCTFSPTNYKRHMQFLHFNFNWTILENK